MTHLASEIAEALRGRKTVNGWMAHCPAHDDKTPSLSITEGAGGKVLVRCYAGCEQSAVIGALHRLGLCLTSTVKHIELQSLAGTNPAPTNEPQALRRPPNADYEARLFKHSEHGTPSLFWVYRDADGPMFVVARYDNPTERKQIVPWTWVGEHWAAKAPPKPRPLYGLDRLEAMPDKPVLLVEGEKTADAAQRYFPARPCVTWMGGVGAVATADWTPLASKKVDIWPDNDPPGLKAGAAIAGKLRALKCTVRVIDPSGWPAKWDLADAEQEKRPRAELVTYAKAHILPAAIPKPANLPAVTGASTEPMQGSQPTTPDESRNDLRFEEIDFSEDGLALAFAERNTDDFRYCHTTGAWFIRTKTHWRRDGSEAAFSSVRDLCRYASRSAPGAEFAKLKKIATATAVERAARSDPRLAVTSEIWDRDPLLLGTPGGVVELSTGILRPARSSDYITKQTSVAPGTSAKPQLWLQFLEQATCGDADLIRFLQQIAGYALTGDTREHALFFSYGSGGNGKGVFVHTLKGIWQDYAAVAPMECVFRRT